MGSFTQPTKARFRNFTIDGFNLFEQGMLNQLKVYETIMKPYITAQATVIDNDNILNNRGWVGGEACSFAFDGNRGPIYEQKLKVLSIKGEKSSQSLRSAIYTIELIGDAYFKDKKELVQQSFKHIPGTNAIQQLHNKFIGSDAPLKILSASLGAIAKESHIISSVNPFKAISDIRKRLNYAKYDTGNTLYFRDALGYVLGPLEQLFDELQPVQTFYQEATWGKSFRDLSRVENAIIAAIAEVEFGSNGRGGMKDIASTATQEKKVFDLRLKKLVIDKKAGKIKPGNIINEIRSLGQEVLNSTIGGHGGVANYMTMDSANLPAVTDGSNNTEKERLYAALTKNGPCITVKVPIQSGMQVTVGKGVKLNLLPPTGDMNTGRNLASGNYLVHSLCHNLTTDDRTVNATTTLSCAKSQ